MLLYILYNVNLLKIPTNTEKEDAIGYVNNTTLLAIAESFEGTTKILEEMMTREEGGIQWNNNHNSRFEVYKSAIAHFSRKMTLDPDSNDRQLPLPRLTLILGNQVIQEVSSYKYLGIQIDSQLKWKEQEQRATANTTKWILQYKCLSRPSTGVSNKLMRQLYLAVALPKITYGIDAWYTPPSKPTGYTKNTGSVKVLLNLKKTQRIASLAITGTLQTTPNDFIDIHANILPMDLALLKACHTAMIHLLTLPEQHPLHNIVKKARHTPPTKHLSSIDMLLKQFKLRHTKIETIYPTIYTQQPKIKFTTKVEPSRKESIKAEANNMANFKIFLDGSGHDNGIGSAAILC